MDVRGLQTKLGVTADGAFGPISRQALLDTFTNTNAPVVTDGEIQAFAERLGCSLKQLRAVAKVESAGGGFDNKGRPKILYERHIFHRLTNGQWTPSTFSQREYGGYGEDSWGKLLLACGKNPDAAFSACSWGKFQVLGAHWSRLGYDSPYALAVSTVASEAAHYELLARYIEKFGLLDELWALSSDPADCAAFAAAYNGPAYVRNHYDRKLAEAMR